MTNTGTTCQNCSNTLTEQDLADIASQMEYGEMSETDPILCENCYWKTQIRPTDWTNFEVTWKDHPKSTRSSSFLDPADVLKQLDILATSTTAYTREHQDEIRVIETHGPAVIAEYSAGEFRAR